MRRRNRRRSGTRVPSGRECSIPGRVPGRGVSRARQCAVRVRHGLDRFVRAPRLVRLGGTLGRRLRHPRLAQWCIAQPPATSAAPISASRWMLMPVIASVEPPPDGDVAEVSVAGVEPAPRLPPVDDGFVVGLELPAVVRRLRRLGGPEMVAPAAGLAVRISGTTQAAAPAVARPTSARAPGASKMCAPSGITRCNRRCPHISICPLLPHVVRPFLCRSGEDFTAVFPPREHFSPDLHATPTAFDAGLPDLQCVDNGPTGPFTTASASVNCATVVKRLIATGSSPWSARLDAAPVSDATPPSTHGGHPDGMMST